MADAELLTDIARLRLFLVAHFGDVSEPLLEEVEGREDELLVMTVRLDETEAVVDLMTMVGLPLSPAAVVTDIEVNKTVSCPNATFRRRVVSVLELAFSTITSLSKSFVVKPSTKIDSSTKTKAEVKGETTVA